MLINGGIAVFLCLMDTVPAYLLEDLKWTNVGNLLRPAFCAMVLNDYATRAPALRRPSPPSASPTSRPSRVVNLTTV